MGSPAEDHAERDGLPVVAVATYELISAATGHPIVVTTMDGARVLLRLLTPEEAIEQQQAALMTLPEEFRPPVMTRARAAEIVAPLAGGR